MNKFKKITFSILLSVVLFVSMCPTFAFASLTPVTFPCSEPYVSSTTGYIAIKGERTDLDNAEQAFLFYYQITPISQSYEYEADSPLLIIEDIYKNAVYFSINGDHYTNYSFSFGVIHQDGTIQNITSDTFTDTYSNGVFYFNSNFLITHIDAHGNIDISALGSDFSTFDYLFTEDKYEYLYLVSIFNVLVEYGELQEDELALLQDILDSNLRIEDALTEITTTFSEKLDTIISDNVVFKERLELIQSYLESIDTTTSDILELFRYFYDEVVSYLYLIDSDLLEIWACVDELEANTDEIESLLQQILDALNVQGESNLTSPDTSQLDNYYEIEQGLVNRSDVDVSNAVNVQIDQNAMAFTWNLIDRFLNSNGKVIGLFLTVLSLGIIALILGR